MSLLSTITHNYNEWITKPWFTSDTTKMPKPQTKNSRGKENNSRTANRSRNSLQKTSQKAAVDLRTCPLCGQGGFSPVDLGLHVTDCADQMEKQQDDDAGIASDGSEELVVTQRPKTVIDDDQDDDQNYAALNNDDEHDSNSSGDDEICVDVPQFVRASQAPGRFKPVVFSDEDEEESEPPPKHTKHTTKNKTHNSRSTSNSPQAKPRRRVVSDDEGSPEPRASTDTTTELHKGDNEEPQRDTATHTHAQVSSMGHTDVSQSVPPASPEHSPVVQKNSRAKPKGTKQSTAKKSKSKASGKVSKTQPRDDTKTQPRDDRAESLPKQRAMSEPLADNDDHLNTHHHTHDEAHDTDYRDMDDTDGHEGAGEDDEHMAMLAARATKKKRDKTSPKSKKKDRSSKSKSSTKRDMAAAKAEAKEKKKKRKSTGSIPDKRSKKKSRSSKPKEHSVVQEGKDGITLTNFPPGDTDWIEQMVKKNNLDDRFDVTDKVTAQTTHVVAGAEPCRRTLNVLRAIAYGCWLVSKNWVFKSYVMGKWQLETEFELQEEYPAAIKERLERELCKAEGVPYQNTLFQDHRFCLTPRRTVPPKEDLEELITACSGQIVKEKSQSTVYVTTTERKAPAAASYHVVSAKWILDSIQKGMLEPFAEMDDVESQRRARRSPEL